MTGDESLDLCRQRCFGVQLWRLPHERGDRRIGIQGVERCGAQQHRSAEGGRVIRDGTVVPDHRIGGQQSLPPPLQRIDQRQPAAPRAIEPGTDLTGSVAVPDVGVQYGREPVLVHGKLRGDPIQQRSDDVTTALFAVTDQ